MDLILQEPQSEKFFLKSSDAAQTQGNEARVDVHTFQQWMTFIRTKVRNFILVLKYRYNNTENMSNTKTKV